MINRQLKTDIGDLSQIVVIGGGPAGSFFAINLLRYAKSLGKRIDVYIIEKKKELKHFEPLHSFACREGCNYCAGGISPRLVDTLEDIGLHLPKEILKGEIKLLTIQGNWKNIELRIPEGRKMLSVFRGSMPAKRIYRYYNFDSYLLQKAVEEGAKIITGEVQDVELTQEGKPLVIYQCTYGEDNSDKYIDADFIVFAGGVNHGADINTKSNKLIKCISKLIPAYVPPRVRKALIYELEIKEEYTNYMEGEIHFVEYGSKELDIEMSSLIPKGRFITVVLIGRSIDKTNKSDIMDIVNKYHELLHIKKLLPSKIIKKPMCLCNPNMTVRVAKNPFDHRAAVIGDLVVSRLYKDGIYSANITAHALVQAIMTAGVDRKSLKKCYWPSIDNIRRDNEYGRFVFMVQRIMLSNPILSRILYQAVLTERKTRKRMDRKLEDILWKVASGDDSYKNILYSMINPVAVRRIIVGGVLITIRNYLMECLFALNWKGFGRYPTGIHFEDCEEKKHELLDLLNDVRIEKTFDYESMYSIKIKARKDKILRQLGMFGD